MSAQIVEPLVDALAMATFEAAVRDAIAEPDHRTSFRIYSRIQSLIAACDGWLDPIDPPLGSEPEDPNPYEPPAPLRNVVAGGSRTIGAVGA